MKNNPTQRTPMKRTLLLLACGFTLQIGMAQELPKWASKAKKSVFSVITYTADNKILNTGNGFYIDTNGIAVSDYTLFKGADHAVVVTADGKELPVISILGANDMYDVIKFQTSVNKKTDALQPATQGAQVGETVYLLPYSTQKAANGQNGTVARIDTIDNSFYYTLNMQTTEKTVSCPVMNSNGEVIGLIQKSADTESKESYAIGIGYAQNLSINALSGNDYTLNSIGIKKGLPSDESQALVYLYVSSSQKTPEEYLNLLNDFISQYPNNTEGYLCRATFYLGTDDLSKISMAEEDIKRMFEVSENQAESHYNFAKLLYNYNIGLGDKQGYTDWNLDKGLEEINQALASDKQGLYYQVQGDIYFAQQKYAEAAASYEALCHTPIGSASSYYSAAKAKELMAEPNYEEIIALMDSAVAKYNKPYGEEAAAFLFERGRFKATAGKHREAVTDYNDFYDAMMGRVNAEFYYIREQSEIQGRMYQQAINDINKAVELEPKNIEYWVEKGGVHMRVNQIDEAIKALQHALSMDNQNAAAYRMLGYCQVQQNNKKEGLDNLQKAKELGDTVAEGLIQKYSK